jgi:uncharacterized protein (DUF3084 family)
MWRFGTYHKFASANLKKHKSKQKKANQKWFDNDCRNLRKSLRNISNQKQQTTKYMASLLGNTEAIQTYPKNKKGTAH